ncbi:MAG: portal protein [Pseudomonadota bacterium]
MDEAGETEQHEAKEDDVLRRALRRFDACAVPQLEMRAECLAARRFAFIPGAQWEGEFGDPFENRIRLEVSKIARGVRKIETDYRSNRIEPDFRPAGGTSDDGTAETLDGLHRADSIRSKAMQARDNAVIEAISGGFGAYRLANELEDEYDRDNDKQVINPGIAIPDADQSVFFDENAKLYDKSDARYGFVITEWSKDAFAEEFGEDRATEWPDPTLRQTWAYDWFPIDAVRVAEYYEKVDESETLHVFTNALTREEERFWDSELADEMKAMLLAEGWQHSRQRRKRCMVMKYVLTGNEVLEEGKRIPGTRIPIVPVYGQRWFIEGKERFKGHVQDRMDAQRLYNASVSRIAEAAAFGTQDIPIFAPEQMTDGIGEQWANRATDRPPYLLAKPLLDPVTGEIKTMGAMGTLAPPTLNQVDAALLMASNNDLTEDDQDSADEVKANTSAEAMDIAAARVDAKSGIYLDNIRQSVQCEGEIYLGMAVEVYSEPGRTVETMTEDDGDGTAVLFERYQEADGASKVRNDFSRGKYKVIASVSEATATRRDKTVKSSLNMAEVALKAGDTELARAAILTAIANTDGEGLDELQEFARRKGLDIGLFKPNEDEAKAMQEAAQQPDPNTQLIAAQGQQLQADAADKAASAAKKQAEIPLIEAKIVETLAKAQAANDGPVIRRGSEFGGQSLQ